MRKTALLLFSTLTFTLHAVLAHALINDPGKTDQQPQEAPFDSFTGKVSKNKVRLRQQANLDSPIIKELSQGDLLIVTGENNDFYAVQPPTGIKAYVFRTYILDNVVEANRVNVRLEPDTEAPIIGQLAAGDHVEGTVSTLNNKWLEIPPPLSARFYVSKDYIENIGDPSLLAKIEKRRDEVSTLLNSTFLAGQEEMKKPFPEINLSSIYANLNKIISDYRDFPEQVARARELIGTVQDNYTQKKISFLEAKAKLAQDDWQNKNSQLSDQMRLQQQRLAQLEQQLQHQKGKPSKPQDKNAPYDKMAVWIPIEKAIYEEWASENNGRSQEEFYLEQQVQAATLKGVLEPYSRLIKNKPGDYILVNPSNNLPIGYLYSTKVNLQDYVGQNITLSVAPRPNNNFAFQAYFVLSIE